MVKDRSVGTSSPLNTLYSGLEDDYRQCRRIRNTAIANQQRQNPHQYFPHQENSNSVSHGANARDQPRLSRFWRTVRSLQLGLRNRNQTSQYVQQINSPDPTDRLTTTSATLSGRPSNIESPFQRANLAVPEPVLNEIPSQSPIVSPPMTISLLSIEQEDEPETTPVKGQTLCKLIDNTSRTSL